MSAKKAGPLRSMTGAGSHVLQTETGRIEVEARSVNNRFLKTSVRALGPLPRVDTLVERVVRRHVARGHVSVHVRARMEHGDPTARIDEEAFQAGARRLAQLAETAGLPAPTTREVLQLPGVIQDERESIEEEAVLRVVEQAVEGAMKELVASREREGQRLADELNRLLEGVAASTEQIAARASEVPAAYRAKLESRLAELLEPTGVKPDPEQIARACAAIADRADVREEVARLEAHVAHARDLIANTRPAGKALDFLIQEFNREGTTIGSKANDLELGRIALALRGDVERLREQVQNVE